MNIRKIIKHTLGTGAVAAFAMALCFSGAALAAAETQSGQKMPSTQQQQKQQQQSQQQQSQQQQATQQTIHRASNIIGKQVKNAEGKDLGKIEDLVLDAYGRVQYVAVAPGEAVDIKDNLAAVPWHAFEIVEGQDHLQLDISPEQLAQAPTFNEGEWQNIADQGQVWIARVIEFYMVPEQVGESTASRMSGQRIFASLDLDNNGTISRNEIQQVGQLSQQFEQADANSDGEISRSEFSAFEQQRGGAMEGQPGQQQQSPGTQQSPEQQSPQQQSQ